VNASVDADDSVGFDLDEFIAVFVADDEDLWMPYSKELFDLVFCLGNDGGIVLISTTFHSR
jgi:hypothetical protein